MQTIRIFTAFSGYDSQCLALERLGIPYELVGWSEIDPFAIRAHNSLFPRCAALTDGLYLRRLTPRECFRLMGVADADIDRIQRAGISDTQQYRMAGNSIVVDVLCHIFRKLFIDPDNENQQLTLF